MIYGYTVTSPHLGDFKYAFCRNLDSDTYTAIVDKITNNTDYWSLGVKATDNINCDNTVVSFSALPSIIDSVIQLFDIQIIEEYNYYPSPDEINKFDSQIEVAVKLEM